MMPSLSYSEICAIILLLTITHKQYKVIQDFPVFILLNNTFITGRQTKCRYYSFVPTAFITKGDKILR